ncbi:hypothetical protein PAPYR_12626 [Paratrimastix pyriformis]|uniref:Uncharacterized protein n=1 Tax=Paratrimastix pyriformis TaxID=342808 RepID=A0ABQ8U893_9EUKA|nr:hypothetical protein PAPYR_12626 [Paratrimastix pyriformis]
MQEQPQSQRFFGALGSDAIRGLFLYLNGVGYQVGQRPQNLTEAEQRIRAAGINHDWNLTTADDNRLLRGMRSNASVSEAVAQAKEGSPVHQALFAHLPAPRAATGAARPATRPRAPPQPRAPREYAPLPVMQPPTRDVNQMLIALRERVDALINLHQQRKAIDAQIDELIRAITGIQLAIGHAAPMPMPMPMLPLSMLPEPEKKVEMPMMPMTMPMFMPQPMPHREPSPERHSSIDTPVPDAAYVIPRTPPPSTQPPPLPTSQEPTRVQPERAAKTPIVPPPRDPQLVRLGLPQAAFFDEEGVLCCSVCKTSYATLTRQIGDGTLIQRFMRHTDSQTHQRNLKKSQTKQAILDDDNTSESDNESEGDEDMKHRLAEMVASFNLINTKSRDAIGPTSAVTYGKSLVAILKKLPVRMQTPQFYENVDEVRRIVLSDKLTPATKKSYGAAINSYIQGLKLSGKEGMQYEKLYNTLMREATPQVDVAKLSQTQVDKWIPYERLVARQQQCFAIFNEALNSCEELKHAVDDPANNFDHDPLARGVERAPLRKAVIDALLTSMYILLPPVRVEEMRRLYIRPQQVPGGKEPDEDTEESEEDDDAPHKGIDYHNWIRWDSQEFMRVKSKMSHLYGTTRILLPDKLFRIMKAQAHIIGNSNELLIPSPRGALYTAQFTARVAEAFGIPGLTVNEIRVIFSTTFSNTFLHNAQLSVWVAKVMGHSITIHTTQYIKRYMPNGEPITVDFVFGGGDPERVPTPWLSAWAITSRGR